MTKRVPKCRFAFFCILISLCAHLYAAESGEPPAVPADERTLAAATSFLETARDVREKDYTNVHFVVIETLVTEDARRRATFRVVTRYEFWSRDNQYFRLDSRVLESNDPRERVGARLRMIVQPQGYVKLRAPAEGEPFTIRDWGDSETGWSYLFGIQHLRAATRYDVVFDADVVIDALLGEPLGLEYEGTGSKVIGRQSKLLFANLSKDGVLLEVKYHGNHVLWRPTEANTTEVSLVCDVQHGVVRRYEAKYYDEKGSLDFTVDEEKAYDFERFGPYPSESRRARAFLKNGGGQSFETKLQRVEWNTATPRGFFSLEAQGFRGVDQGEVWGRRSLIALIGVSLFVVALVIKRLRNRDNA